MVFGVTLLVQFCCFVLARKWFFGFQGSVLPAVSFFFKDKLLFHPLNYYPS